MWEYAENIGSLLKEKLRARGNKTTIDHLAHQISSNVTNYIS